MRPELYDRRCTCYAVINGELSTELTLSPRPTSRPSVRSSAGFRRREGGSFETIKRQRVPNCHEQRELRLHTPTSDLSGLPTRRLAFPRPSSSSRRRLSESSPPLPTMRAAAPAEERTLLSSLRQTVYVSHPSSPRSRRTVIEFVWCWRQYVSAARDRAAAVLFCVVRRFSGVVAPRLIVGNLSPILSP